MLHAVCPVSRLAQLLDCISHPVLDEEAILPRFNYPGVAHDPKVL
jgi:hypothetical protein